MQAPTPADAWQSVAGGIGDYITQQRAQSVADGLLDPNTGMPTAAGMRAAGQSYADAMVGSTVAPGAPRMPTSVITTQRYLDDGVVAKKLKTGNFDVSVSPKFNVDGADYRVMLDGHHAYEAARQAGVKPNFLEATPQTNDAVSLLKKGDTEGFLETVHSGEGDYVHAHSGRYVDWGAPNPTVGTPNRLVPDNQ